MYMQFVNAALRFKVLSYCSFYYLFPIHSIISWKISDKGTWMSASPAHKLLLAYHIQRMFPLPQQLLSVIFFHRFTPTSPSFPIP